MQDNINLNRVRGRRSKFMKNARILSLTKDKKWIESMVMSGYIGLPNDYTGDGNARWKEEWAVNYLLQINAIIDTLEVAHPGNWDMHIQEHNNQRFEEGYPDEKRFLYSLHPMIRYPDITISNSLDLSTQIKDLVVTIPLSKNHNFSEFDFRIGDILGTRYHFSYDHYKYGYRHSHLPTNTDNPAGGLSEFCIGTDELYDINVEMQSNGLDEGMFGLWLSMLDNVVRWESREGGPYVYMKHIVDTSKELEVNPDRGFISNHYRRRFRPWLRDLRQFPVNFVYNQGRYQIKKDGQLDDFVKKFIMEYSNGEYISELLCKERDGRYYGPKQSIQDDIPEIIRNKRQSDGEVPYTIISGQKIKLQIQRTVFESEDITNFKVHPKFLDYVTKQLERELYEKAVTSSAVGRQTELSNA